MSSRAMASHDANRVQTGLTHKMMGGRKLTAVRNRQTVKTACGRMIYRALPVKEPSVFGVPGKDCLSCWPASQISKLKIPPPNSVVASDVEAKILEEVTELLKQTSEIHRKVDKILVTLGKRLEKRRI